MMDSSESDRSRSGAGISGRGGKDDVSAWSSARVDDDAYVWWDGDALAGTGMSRQRRSVDTGIARTLRGSGRKGDLLCRWT